MSVIFIVVLYLMVTEEGLVAVAEEPDVLVYVMVAVGVHPSAVHVNVIFGVIAVAAVALTVVAAVTVPLEPDNVPFVYPVAAARLAVQVVPYPTVKLCAEEVDVFVTSEANVPSDFLFLYFSVMV